MNFSIRAKDCSPFQYKLGMVVIFILSLMFRFWNLSRFNSFVFDEVYYAKFANNYLIGTYFFNSHPPLSQYIIAVGIWIGSHLPASPDTVNNLTGSLRSTFSYRWINAFSGSFIPVLVAAIAYQLTQRRIYSFIAALLVLSDGLFLVESRYALNNIYLILFGLLGHLFFLLSLRSSRKNLYLVLSGIFLGCAISVKWNGLAFLLGILVFLSILKSKSLYVLRNRLQLDIRAFLTNNQLLFYLIIIPTITYYLIWLPHLKMNPQYNFWEVHQEILAFHQKITGNDSKIHPYCSPWYSWPIMWRPIAYLYEIKIVNNQKIIYDVHAMGNPVLWWLSTLAILIFSLALIVKLIKKQSNYNFYFEPILITYIFCNYAAHILPWIVVSRCTFIYHYLGAYSFAMLALAWLVARWLSSDLIAYRILGILTLLSIVMAFFYWLPIYLGLPLSEREFHLRMLFKNWI